MEIDSSIARRLQLVVEGTNDYAIFMLDPHGRIQTWNAGAQRIKGYSADEVIGRHFSLFYTENDIARRHPAYELDVAIREGKYEEEGWRVRKDGSEFWASVTITALRDSDGELQGFGKVTRDLTKRKADEDALRQAEELFRLAFDAAPTGIGICDTSGRWLRINDALCSITGQTRTELLARTVGQTLDTSAAVTGALLAGEAPKDDLQLKRPDDSRVWVHVGVGTVRGYQQEVVQQVIQVEDVSVRVATQEALLDAEQAKSRFVAVASHELRSPLTAILGYATMLHRRWDSIDDSRKRDAVQTMERQGRRLRLLVEDLLTLSSLEADGMKLNRRTVDLRDLLDEIVVGIESPVTYDGDLDAHVDADPLRLSQILTNLLVNAQKYGGPPLAVNVVRHNDTVDISVIDHGNGIPAEFVPRMFDRFTQADDGLRRRSQGTGLGLAIVKTLANAHRAELTYSMTPGGGATFTLTLPVAD